MILTDNTKQILQDIKYFGGTISLKDDNLKLSFPDDFNNSDLLERIKINKSSLINFLVNGNRITPTLKKTDFKATLGQKGLWLLSQFEVGSNAYHITTVFDLTGNVNPNFLEKSFQILMDRHEILRTTFYVDEEGELYQQIHEKGTLNLDFNFFREYEFSKQEELLERYRNTLFDLGKDSLFRCVLIKGNERKYILGLTLHHIISDGWSVGVLIKELLHIYDQLNEGGNVVLPELKIQYKDYACWLTNQISNMELSQSYWKDKLSGELPMLDLLGYQTRPRVKTYVGNRVLLSIDKLRVEKWKQTCKENNATLFMGLLSGLNAILHRYTSQQDFIIGTVTTGRIHQDLINQIGFYVNTLPIRAKVNSESSFLDLLSEVRETTLEAFEHQEYSFNAILEDIDIRRDASKSPLFDCMLVLQNNEKIGIESKGLKVIQRDNVSKTSKYDISFVFTENKDGDLNLELEYNTDLYQKDFMKQLGAHYINMINEMVVNENLPICSLEYLSEQEKYQLLVDFNDTNVDYPKNKTIVDLFEEQVTKIPNNIAVVFGESKLSYCELNEKVNQLAHYIASEFIINKGDIVGVFLAKSDVGIITLLAILKLGGVYLPIDTNYPQERIDYLIKDSGLKLIIGKSFDLETANSDILNINDINLEKYSSQNIAKEISSKDLAYIIYTSGSTGQPKGVMVAHTSNVNMSLDQIKSFNITGSDKVVWFASVSFDASISEIMMCLYSGATLCIPTEETIKDKDEFVRFLKKTESTVVTFPPSYLELLSQDDIIGLRCIITAGESANSKKALEIVKSGIDYYNAYGPTECAVCVSIYKVNENDIDKYIIPIGTPIASTQVYILDEALQPLPIGVSGKIYVSGVGVARGYLNKPELTAEKFFLNPFIKGTRMYDTGDLGRRLPDGDIEFLGRKDHQVKIRGFRIELGEIETYVSQYSDEIQQVIVEAKKISQDKSLVAYYVSKSEIDKSEIRSYLEKKLPEYMVPSFYVRLESIPLTTNGKIDRKSLPEISGEDNIRKVYVAPRNEIEKQLIEIWEEILGIEKIGITDNFFELGGHSLILFKLQNEINKQFKIDVPFKNLYDDITIEKISNIINIHNNESLKIEISFINKTSYQTTPFQRGLYFLQQLDSNSIAYNIPVSVIVKNDFSKDKFEQAFSRLIKRHESFRTIFYREEYTIVQSIEEENVLNVSYVEIEDQNEIDTTIESFVSPFNLSKLPLIKVLIIKQKDKYYLTFDMHHIIVDGTSLSIFFNELAMLYYGRDLEDKPFRYVDYAEFLASPKWSIQLEKQRAYWISEHNDLLDNELPLDFKRTEKQNFEGDTVYKILGLNVLNSVRKIARKNATTEFTVFMSIFSIFLSKLYASEEITFGFPVFNRRFPELKNTVGMFVNTLVLKIQVDQNQHFLDFLSMMKIKIGEALDNQEYPFEQLVEDVKIKNNFNRNPLFDIMLGYQNKNFINYESIENEIEFYENENKKKMSKFDMSINVIEKADDYHLEINYCTKLFKKNTIVIFMDYFENLIHEVLNKTSGILLNLPEFPINKTLKDQNKFELDSKQREVTIYNNLFMQNDILNLWKKILNIKEINIDDSYNDIGGTSLKFLIMIGEVGKKYNIDLMFHEFPRDVSIKQLVNIVLSKTVNMSENSRFKHLVPISIKGLEFKTIIFVHEISGDIEAYSNFVEILKESYNIYGVVSNYQELYPNYLDIKSTISPYVDEILTLGNIPLNIIGWSVGGILGYEIVQQLLEKEVEISSFVMMDSPIESNYPLIVLEDEINRIDSFLKINDIFFDFSNINSIKHLWEESIESLCLIDKKDIVSFLKKEYAEFFRMIPNLEDLYTKEEIFKKINHYRSFSLCCTRYTPNPIKQTITYIVASSSKKYGFVKEWGKYSFQDIKIIEVEGDHFSLVKESNQVGVILEKLKVIIN